MAQIEYLDLTGLQQFKGLIDIELAKSFKSANFDEESRVLSLFKTETPTGVADFTVTIPKTDISGLMEKLTTTNVGNIVITKADGTIEDSNVVLANIATKDEVEVVDEKVGEITELNTTAKTDLVSAINEVRNSVSAGGTQAAITISTDTTTKGMLKSYTIKQGDNTVGVVDIPKDLVVTSGTVVTNPEGQDEGTYIKLIVANQEEPLYINVGTLVDLYTAKENATQIQLTVDNSTREISAAIVSGSVGSDELGTNAVTTVKIADSNVTLAKLASDVKNAFDVAGSATAAETNAKTYTDALANGTVANNTSAIEALEEKVGDGFTTITKEQISAMFV